MDTKDTITVSCPHCNLLIEVLQVNCGIFRHGVYRQSNKQIPPHLSKPQCDLLKQRDLIWGCGKPFQVFKKENISEWQAVICDYI